MIDTTKKKQSIFRIFFIPLILLMLAQSLLTLGILMFRGTVQTIQDYSIGMMVRMVENRKVILQNDMTQRWSAIAYQENAMNQVLEKFLVEKDVTLEEMLSSDELKAEFLNTVFPVCMSLGENNMTTGIFYILTGDNMIDSQEFRGFFLRDSNPLSNSANYYDLLLERGSKSLSRNYGIGLDTYWTSVFRMQGAGNHEEDNFFYMPWLTATQYPSAAIKDLGYWSKPFVLGADTRDSHEMITYSVPLRYNGIVYAVMGVEISTSYLYDYLPVGELVSNEQAGYMIAVEHDDGTYTPLIEKGVLANLVREAAPEFSLKETSHNYFYQVKDIRLGKQKVYAVKIPLKLYSTHVPYSDTNWVLIGLNHEEELFGMGRQLYVWIIAALLIGLLFGLICISVMVHRLTSPIKRLMDCISHGRSGLAEYQPSNILEVDALYDVVEDLTGRQLAAEDVLIEEKELYRVALETSQDIFFSIDLIHQTMDIMNSASNDGHWNSRDLKTGLLDLTYVHEYDRDLVRETMERMPKDWSIEYRLKLPGNNEYRWVSVKGNVITDTEGRRWKVVGRFRDIQEQKEREEKELKKHIIDGVTGFYTYSYGIQLLEEVRSSCGHGVLIYLCMDNFREINEQNGNTFSDMILEEIAELISDNVSYKNVIIRFDVDAICIWLQECSESEAEVWFTQLLDQIQRQLEPELFPLMIHAGIACPENHESSTSLIRKAKQAQIYVSEHNEDNGFFFYREIADKPNLPHVSWRGRQLVTTEYGLDINRVSLALAIFGKGENLAAQMRLMFRKLGQFCGADTILLSVIQRDFRSVYTEYQWSRQASPVESGHAFTYTDSALEAFTEEISQKPYLTWKEGKPLGENAALFCQSDDSRNGYAIPLYDNGTLTGILTIRNVYQQILTQEDEIKSLLEISGVIQGQINQQRHDLASKAKSNFLSRMSHEIRTPMNGIVGMTAIALQKNQRPEKVADCLQKIQMSSEYLLGLINDILDMSKIESGKMTLEAADFSMKEMIDTMLELLMPQAEAKNIDLDAHIQLKNDWFVADQLRISQVLINLLGNALKFTPERGQIHLTVREQASENASSLYFSVRDTGIGIAYEDQDRVFRSFEQASNHSPSGMKGTGLGLSISSRLIKMMGSTIHLISTPGQGSEFYFTLTLPHGTPQKTGETLPKCTFEGYHVLVVEDNELNAEIATEILQEAHFKVDCVYDGAQAVQRIKETAPGTYDLILMDIMMPVMDGLEATKTIRAMEREDCRTIPIIAMSANAFDDDLKKSVECGMNGHLAKPVEIDKMYQLLDEILRASKNDSSKSAN